MQLHLPGRCPWRRSCSHCRHPEYIEEMTFGAAPRPCCSGQSPHQCYSYIILPSSTPGDTRPVARSSSVTLLIICPLPTVGYVVDETFSTYFASGSKNVIVYYVNTQPTIKLYVNTNRSNFVVGNHKHGQTAGRRRRALTRWLIEHATVTVNCDGRFVY